MSPLLPPLSPKSGSLVLWKYCTGNMSVDKIFWKFSVSGMGWSPVDKGRKPIYGVYSVVKSSHCPLQGGSSNINLPVTRWLSGSPEGWCYIECQSLLLASWAHSAMPIAWGQIWFRFGNEVRGYSFSLTLAFCSLFWLYKPSNNLSGYSSILPLVGLLSVLVWLRWF